MLIFFFPTWLSSSYKEREIIAQSEQMNRTLLDSNTNPATSVIKTINSRLGVINTSLQYPKLLPHLNTVLSNKTSAIQLTHFSYTVTASTTATFIVSGVSATRESLVSYVKKLEETKSFKKVDLPISNLAKEKNIDFTINILIAS